jgi:hypothetical protein
MSTVVRDGSMVTRLGEREVMTDEQLHDLAERTAQELLAMSADDAFRLLDEGVFAGQGVEGTLRGLQRLLSA